MNTFRLRPEGFRYAHQRLLARRIPVSLLGLSVPLYLAWHFDAPVRLLVILAPILVLFVGFGLFVMTVLQRIAWSSYELSLTPDSIRRKQALAPDVEIRLDEVTHLREQRGEGMVVNTADSRKSIIVPASLDGYEEVKAQLGEWRMLEQTSKVKSHFWQWLAILLSIASIVAYAVALVAETIEVALVAGAFPSVMIVLYIVFVLWNRYMDYYTRFTCWLAPLSLAPLAVKVVSLLIVGSIGWTAVGEVNVESGSLLVIDPSYVDASYAVDASDELTVRINGIPAGQYEGQVREARGSGAGAVARTSPQSKARTRLGSRRQRFANLHRPFSHHRWMGRGRPPS